MSYKIKNKKKFHKQFRKRLLNQVDAAIQEIQDGSMPFDKKIHQTRKRFKKIRGLLRLGMKTLGKKRYKEENSRFREYGHRLAHARDSKVYLKTLNSMAEDSVDKRKIKGLKQALEEEYNHARHTVLEEEILKNLAKDLLKNRAVYIEMPLKKAGNKAFVKGLTRVFLRGEKALKNAQKQPTPENFHELRKRVKYLWYHMRLLKKSNRQVNGAYADILDNLSDNLGDAHDLSLLENRLKKEKVTGNKKQINALQKETNRRNEKLRRKSIKKSRDIFIEPNDAFIERQLIFWNDK